MLESLNNLLPERVAKALMCIGCAQIYEVRLRVGRAATVNVGGQYRYLGMNGTSAYREDALIMTEKDILTTVLKAAEHSVYAVTEQLAQAFVTVSGGIRVGVCGASVVEDGKILAVKDYGSVVIRIPHEIIGCSQMIPLKNDSILIASLPARGKTTFLRDLARRASLDYARNVVVIDERGEIAACKAGNPTLNVGDSDVLTDCPKTYGFRQAVRVLRPDVIVTDELVTTEDFDAIEKAMHDGIRIIASVHARTLEDVAKKLNGRHVFDRIVMLADVEQPGVINQIVEGSARL